MALARHQPSLFDILLSSLQGMPSDVIDRCILPYLFDVSEERILDLMMKSMTPANIPGYVFYGRGSQNNGHRCNYFSNNYTYLKWVKAPDGPVVTQEDAFLKRQGISVTIEFKPDEAYYLSDASIDERHHDRVDYNFATLIPQYKRLGISLTATSIASSLINEFPMLSPSHFGDSHLWSLSNPEYDLMTVTLKRLPNNVLMAVEKRATEKCIVASLTNELQYLYDLWSQYKVVRDDSIKRILLIFKNIPTASEVEIKAWLSTDILRDGNHPIRSCHFFFSFGLIKDLIIDAFIKTDLITLDEKRAMAKVGTAFSLCVDWHRNPPEKQLRHSFRLWGHSLGVCSSVSITDSREKINKALGVKGHPDYVPSAGVQIPMQNALDVSSSSTSSSSTSSTTAISRSSGLGR